MECIQLFGCAQISLPAIKNMYILQGLFLAREMASVEGNVDVTDLAELIRELVWLRIE